MRPLIISFVLLMLGIRPAIGATTLQPVTGLDLNRYQAVWFEIAKYPNRFQKICSGGTTEIGRAHV